MHTYRITIRVVDPALVAQAQYALADLPGTKVLGVERARDRQPAQAGEAPREHAEEPAP